MKNFRYESELFGAFVKTVQYIVGLKQLPEVEEHLSLFLVAHFPATWIAFVRKETDGTISLPYYTLKDAEAVGLALTDEFKELAADVLTTGFMATSLLAAPEPSMTVLLPVVVEGDVERVMLIGHAGAEPVPNEMLDVYLAVSGMVGATFERVYYEQELTRHREHLEELVRARTAALEREVAERKKAERLLHEERERLAVTLGSIGDGVIATDTGKNVVMINQVAQELTGWTQAEASGRPLMEVFEIVNEVTGEPAADPVRRALETGTIVGLANHTALIARDGTRYSIADSCAPIRSQDGTIIGAVLVFRDVTNEKRAARLREALNEINTSINSTLDFDRIMQAVVVEAARTLGCVSASIEMRRDDHWEVRYLYGLPPETAGMRIPKEIAHGLEEMARSKDVYLIKGEDVGSKLDRTVIEAFRIGSLMLMPIMIRGKVIAALRFVHDTSAAEFTDLQLDFAVKLSASLSLALENSRLYTLERHIAETLQEALLITPQELPGISFGHLYHSATESARIGGDFYDIFEIDDRRIGIVIGDVSGKGVSAASLTVIVENTVKAFAHQGYSPADVLERTNTVIMRAAGDRFVTVFFCILETDTGRLSYCSGGHPPAVIKRRDGAIEHLDTVSPLIGAFPWLEFTGDETRLGAGDVLVLYTDGAIESRSADGEFFGRERLAQALAHAHPARELPHHIFATVNAFTGGTLNDDMALLAISLKTPGEVPRQD